MASILFDDITFPRELYDPDTFEFVAPVSTLLTFTPHIISQLAKTSEEQQEPIPLPNLTPTTPTADNPETTHTSPSSAEQTSTPRATETQSTSGGIFSSFKNFANSQGTQQILNNGLYLAGRYMDGSASARRSSSYEDDHRYDTRSRQSTSSWFGSSSSSNRYEYRDQERQRLRDMEDQMRQMERDMRQQSAMARSEVDAQRRQRVQLEQELESQKQKVAKLEKEVEQQQKEQEANKKKQQEEEKKKKKQEEKKKKKQEEEEAAAAEKKKKSEAKEDKKDKEKEKSSSQDVTTTDSGADAANAVLMATVGVASLVMSLYAAHQASSTYSVVRFHDQLELLIEQCEGVIQSTEAWMSEQFLEVPDQIRQDLKMLKELIETIQRLDPRSEKKAETVAWSMSAVGSIGAVGGAVLGSMTAMASGGTLVVGCALYGIINRARFTGPEYNAAKSMMEVRAIQILKSLGVNPNAPGAAPSSSSRGGRSVSLIHESRLERLRIEFERREGLEMGDANEIDGLAVEEALLESSFSAPFVSRKATAAGWSRQQSGASAAAAAAVLEDTRPILSMKSESKRVSILA
ncbi:hypothetical protein KI688_005800 [Linnemannia hyalina]|uniref:Uncharacterized protein n=1 Tax=Linnemannia hyalina TaxID=64524 RepID=A0A9P7Y3T2_9FUNG|nr:hypothetical protein KI688_005800 [Linnemannia hyalina]